MSIFSLMAVGGTGFGPVYSGWIEINPKLEWKWIQWIHMMQVIPPLTDKIDYLYKKIPSIQDQWIISSVTYTRHERNAFVDYFNKNGKETQKNNGRSSVSCESGR